LKMSPLSDDELEGFEHQLTEWQNYLDEFNEECARSSFAADKGFPTKEEGFSGKLVCGFSTYPGQSKKDGTLMWHCPFKFSFEYWALKDKNGVTKRSAHLDSKQDLYELKEDGDIIEKLSYDGCPRHSQISVGENDDFDL